MRNQNPTQDELMQSMMASYNQQKSNNEPTQDELMQSMMESYNKPVGIPQQLTRSVGGGLLGGTENIAKHALVGISNLPSKLMQIALGTDVKSALNPKEGERLNKLYGIESPDTSYITNAFRKISPEALGFYKGVPDSWYNLLARGVGEALPTAFIPGLGEVKAAEGAGLLGKIGAGALNLGSRSIPQAVYGAMASTNPLSGALSYGAGELAAPAISAPFKAAYGIGKKAYRYINPLEQSITDSSIPVLDKLSGGLSKRQNRQVASDKIINTYNKLRDIEKNGWGNLFNNNSNSNLPIFKTERELKPSYFSSGFPSGIKSEFLNSYEELPDEISSIKDIKDKFNSFNKNRSLNNIHSLRKEIGEEIGSIKNNYSAPKDNIPVLGDMYEKLGNDIRSGLDSISPGLSNSFDELNKFHRENIVPYHGIPKIRDLVKDKTDILENLSNTFLNPRKSIGDTDNYIQRIMSHQDPDFNKHILYDALPAAPYSKPENLGKNLLKVKDKYEKFFDPETNIDLNNLLNEKSLMDLKSKKKPSDADEYFKKTIKHGIPVGLGVMAAHSMGLPGEVGAILGMGAPYLADVSAKKLSRGVNALSKLPQPIKSSARNIINLPVKSYLNEDNQ